MFTNKSYGGRTLSIAVGIITVAILLMAGAGEAVKLQGNGATKESSIYIDFDVTDALLSKDGKDLYLSSKPDKSLYIINLTTGGVDNFSFNNMTESLTMTPKGDSIFLSLLSQEHSYYWFDNREGYIAEINPYTRSLVREFRINEDPYDFITTSDGHLYVSSGSGQWTYIKGYNLTTVAESGVAVIRQMEHIKLHPSEKYIYSANTDVSPSDIQKFSISNGAIQALYDSPYHGDYPMCGDLEISPDGTKIFTKCGHVFLSTENQSTDMTHIGTLGDEWNSLTFDDSNNIYTVSSASLRKYNYDTYELIGGSPINGSGRFVFYKNGHLIVVTEGGNYPTKSSIKIIDVLPTPPGSVTDLNESAAGSSWINWTWINPIDEDLNHILIYIDGEFKTKADKNTNYYKATGLSPASIHTISTRTVDIWGNINQTWINDTAITGVPDVTPPEITFVSPTPANNSEMNVNYINISIILSEPGGVEYLFWNGSIENMTGSGESFFKNKTGLANGVYDYYVNASDTEGNFNTSEIRRVIINATAQPRTITVDDNGGADFTRIQDAIDNASAGDTILVYSGTYHENVNVDKQLTLRGIDNSGGMPMVDAGSFESGFCSKAATAITLSAGWSNIEGFKAVNSCGWDYAGIRVISNNNKIINNTISENSDGISISSSHNNILYNNNVSNNYVGIRLEYSNNNTLISNIALYNRFGIEVTNSGENILDFNNASNNFDRGISVHSSSNNNILTNNVANSNDQDVFLDGGGFLIGNNNNTLNNNTAFNNTYGIYLVSSSNITLSGNNASNNDIGINLYGSSNITLSGNNASNNDYSIYLRSSSNNMLSGNNASNNDVGIYLLYSSDNNSIYNNVFNNTNNFYIENSVSNWNITKRKGTNIIGGSYLSGNFWAYPNGTGFSQTCSDSDKDGICDSPYMLDSSNTDYLPLAYKPVIPTSTEPVLLASLNDISGGCGSNINFTKVVFGLKIGTTIMWDGFEHADEDVGIYYLDSKNNTDFTNISIYLTNNQNDLVWSLVQSVGDGECGRGYSEADWIKGNPDLAGYSIDFIRLIIHNLSIKPYNGGPPDISTLVISNITWEVWGYPSQLSPIPTSIVVSPSTAKLTVGGTQQFTAIAKYQNGTPVAGINILWTSSNMTVGNIAPSNAITDANGNATATLTALVSGTATVNATNGTVAGNASITVNPAPLIGAPEITSFDPLTATVTNNVGESRTFSITTNQTVNVSWLINGTEVFNETEVITSSYTNSSAALGTRNVTAMVSNLNGIAMKTWDWIVTPIPTSGSISGFDINDTNGNGKWDSGEAGIQGWNITLKNTTTGEIIASNLTDNNGFYKFTNLANGSYNVTEEIRTGFTPTNATFRQVNIAGQNVMNMNFTNQPLVSDLIKNPGFESGTSPWLFYTNGTGKFTAESPGYEGSKSAKIVIYTGGTNIQLYQKGISLEPHTRYRLSFAANSTKGHDLKVALIKHVSPYTVYGLYQTFNLSASWQEFSTEFTTSGFSGTVNDGRLMFFLAPYAKAGDTYYIDNVLLEKI